MDFERLMGELFSAEDSARAMANRLMDIAKRDPAAAAKEKDSVLAFIRGPMERHMVHEEVAIFPLLIEHDLGAEVEVAKKQHDTLREEAVNLENAKDEAGIARAIYYAARLMLHHTNFEGDYIYPELSKAEWHALMAATQEPKK